MRTYVYACACLCAYLCVLLSYLNILFCVLSCRALRFAVSEVLDASGGCLHFRRAQPHGVYPLVPPYRRASEVYAS